MRNLPKKLWPRFKSGGRDTLSARHRGCKRGIAVLAVLTALFAPATALKAADARPGGAIIRALQAMQNDQWTQARRLVAESRDPLALKLYYWMYFRQPATGADSDTQFSILANFAKTHRDWPDIGDLRSRAEYNMPGDLGAEDVISWFALFPPATAAGLDRYLEALLIRGRKEEAQKILTGWWASKLTTRDEQRAIYMKYGRMLDTDAHRRRLDTLLFSGQYTNARSIAQVLGKGYPELVEARIALAENKPNVTGLINKVPSRLQSDPGLLYERLSWRRRNNMDMDAVKILHEHPPVSKISNPESWWKEQHIIIRRLLEKHMYESAYLLATDHFQTSGVSYADAEWMAGWLALRFMKKPEKAYMRFEALYEKVETPISKARAAYWAGRAAEAMKQRDLAVSWYQKAAKYQTVFYGQLAGVKLGLAQALPNAAPPELTADDINRMGNDDMVRAAAYLYYAGMHKEAGGFLDAFVDREKSPKAYRYAAELAGRLGDKRDAVKIAKDATRDGMFLTAQSFPVITDQLQNVDTEWALVHAIIRQESMFDPQAVSPVGALGLMQLMPRTAAEIARRNGLPQNTAALTSNPNYNIRLGTAYLNHLLSQYDGFYPMAIAAYNGGPKRVNEAISDFGDPRKGQIDLTDWIELISVPETRNYTQRVLESVYIYRLRLKNIQKTPDAPIHIAMESRIKLPPAPPPAQKPAQKPAGKTMPSAPRATR